jgi:phytoene desaturase
MSRKKVVIIGAGIAGMAASIRLIKMGYEVDVYEASDTFGGKIKEHSWQDYRFDSGPSLFTMPELVDELFILCQKDPRKYINYKQLPIVTKYFYQNGTVINSYSDAVEFAKEAKLKLGVNEQVIHSYLKIQKKTYELLAPIFLENPIHIFSRLFKFKNLKALWHIMNPRFLLTMHKVNNNHFKNKELTQLFNRYGTYNGSNPYVMPSLFNIISHLEHNKGAYLPEKGMRQVVGSIYQLAVEEGVRFHFNLYVNSVTSDRLTATGVKVMGVDIPADQVVSNMAVNNTFEKLLPNVKAPKHYLKNEKSTSALIFQWAMKGNFPQLDVHNILFAKDYKAEFDHLFGLKKIYIDPTVYIYISSKVVKGDAPSGGENWFVMVNTPHLTGNENWDDLKLELKKIIINKINIFLKQDLEEHILNENCITPADLQNTTHSYLGSLYGGSSNSMISAFLRHPNFSKVKGLYFCGGTVHPGGGIPLCLLSAKITAGLIKEKHNH